MRRRIFTQDIAASTGTAACGPRAAADIAGDRTPPCRIDLGSRPRILVIVMRRLGDVLLTTPLLRTLRKGLPDATIEVLVFQGTEGILSGNPDINAVIAFPQRPSAGAQLALACRLWRRYDLAISTQSGDRPTLLAYLAGRWRAGVAPSVQEKGNWWKRRVLHASVTSDRRNHRVDELLQLTDELGLARHPELVCASAQRRPVLPGMTESRYAVVHANPMYRFRRWTEEGWRCLARELARRGLAVVATGGPDAAERAYLDAVWGPADPPVRRVDGLLSWPELSDLIGGAAVYVGPDTSMSHLAAATGCPTVALYGPASPRHIGPWPIGGLDKPWEPAGRIQNRGNVWVVQNPLPCLPCEKLGCEAHYESFSRCLDELTVSHVLEAVDCALAKEPAGSRIDTDISALDDTQPRVRV